MQQFLTSAMHNVYRSKRNRVVGYLRKYSYSYHGRTVGSTICVQPNTAVEPYTRCRLITKDSEVGYSGARV